MPALHDEPALLIPDVAERRTRAHDLTHLDAARQHEYLQSHAGDPRARQTVFHLRGNFADLLRRIRGLRLNANDIDGTLTGVGDARLHDSAIDGIGDLRGAGIETIGITGRHELQILELAAAHGAHGLREVIGEQGAIIVRGREVEHYMGSAEILEELSTLRAMLRDCFGAIASEEKIRFVPTSGGHHRFQYSMDAQDGRGMKIIEKALHERVMSRIGEFVDARRKSFAAWQLGTSSTGTFELAHADLKKLKALRRRMSELGVAEHETVFKGDSGNDMDVFREESDILKVAVVNPHTKPELIGSAHFATVGVGNAAPMFRFIAETRRRPA